MARIEVDHLTKRYGAVTAVDDLSFSLEPGSITGFVGANGAGKSTTLRMLLGLTRPTSGIATIDGRPYADLPDPAHAVGALTDAEYAAAVPSQIDLRLVTVREGVFADARAAGVDFQNYEAVKRAFALAE